MNSCSPKFVLTFTVQSLKKKKAGSDIRELAWCYQLGQGVIRSCPDTHRKVLMFC